MSAPTITVREREDSRGEWPNASTMAIARLVCEHGTVLWVMFGPVGVGLRADEGEAKRPCSCLPSIAVIYP